MAGAEFVELSGRGDGSSKGLVGEPVPTCEYIGVFADQGGAGAFWRHPRAHHGLVVAATGHCLAGTITTSVVMGGVCMCGGGAEVEEDERDENKDA